MTNTTGYRLNGGQMVFQDLEQLAHVDVNEKRAQA